MKYLAIVVAVFAFGSLVFAENYFPYQDDASGIYYGTTNNPIDSGGSIESTGSVPSSQSIDSGGSIPAGGSIGSGSRNSSDEPSANPFAGGRGSRPASFAEIV